MSPAVVLSGGEQRRQVQGGGVMQPACGEAVRHPEATAALIDTTMYDHKGEGAQDNPWFKVAVSFTFVSG
jgi:hypothetical protein